MKPKPPPIATPAGPTPLADRREAVRQTVRQKMRAAGVIKTEDRGDCPVCNHGPKAA